MKDIRYLSAQELADFLDAKPHRGGWRTFCRAHNDQHNPNFYINEGADGTCLVWCGAGCSQEAILDALRKLGIAPRSASKGQNPAGPGPVGHPASKPTKRVVQTVASPVPDGRSPDDGSQWRKPDTDPPALGVTLKMFEAYRAIPAARLAQWGVSEQTDKAGHTKLRIPYLDASGDVELFVHYRHRMEKGPDGEWPPRFTSESKTTPYGQWRLGQARELGYVFVVEGESDCWTLWHHGFPAVGFPGVNSCPKVDWKLLDGIEHVFVVVEPGGGGEAFRKKLEDAPIKAHVVFLGWGASWKDVSGMYLAYAGLPLSFREQFAMTVRLLLGRTPPTEFPGAITGAELAAKVFPARRDIIDGVLLRGCTLFAGKPKMGKSWWALGQSLPVAGGGMAMGRIPVAPTEVLYWALEDGEERLQERQDTLVPDGQIPPGLTFWTDPPDTDQDPIALLEAWLDLHPGCGLIVIDTLTKLREPVGKNSHLYQTDYDALSPLQDLAKRRNVAILVIYHFRKMAAEDDWVDSFSGSTGLTAACDHLIGFFRKRGEPTAYLQLVGRDDDETRINMRWDDHNPWLIDEDIDRFTGKTQGDSICRRLAQYPEGLTRHELADGTGIPYGSLKVVVRKLLRRGDLVGEGQDKRIRLLEEKVVPFVPLSSEVSVGAKNDGNFQGNLEGTSSRPPEEGSSRAEITEEETGTLFPLSSRGVPASEASVGAKNRPKGTKGTTLGGPVPIGTMCPVCFAIRLPSGCSCDYEENGKAGPKA